MKQLLLILAIAGMALSSCTGKYTIAKRKYTKGFYVSRSSEIKNSETKFTKANVLKGKQITSELAMNSTDEIIPTSLTSIAATPELNHSKTSANKSYKSKGQNSPVVASADKHVIDNVKSIKPLEIRNPLILPIKKGGSDANTIILVLLCLIWMLGLISVYIHDGKSITMNFWLTLILYILGYLPGIIFSILVVLDVVNLA